MIGFLGFYGNRLISVKALVGSHNYNLQTEQSDRDYKYFVLPTFNDLYKGRMFSTAVVGKDMDYDVHDSRKLIDLFWKSNISFLEVLYSKQVDIIPEFNEIFLMRDKIATMNLRYLYSACKGMHFEKMKNLLKGTEGTQHLVAMYGYDTKQAMHAYRVLDFCIRFAKTNFTDFEKALRYTDEEAKQLLSIKHGRFNVMEFEAVATALLAEFSKYEEAFIKREPDLETKEILSDLIRIIIKRNLLNLRD